MKYLMYCIFHTPRHQKPEGPPGVDDLSVALVSNNGLTAAISGITQPNLLPDVSRILTYKRVIESFHRDRTVIPMRYGCMLNDKQQVCRLLEENSDQYGRLLGTIKGCVEMGIRILIADERLEIAELKKNERQFLFNGDKSRQSGPKPETSGRAYISARKTHYDREDQVDKEIETVLDHFHRAFSRALYPVQIRIPKSSSLALFFSTQRRCQTVSAGIFEYQSRCCGRKASFKRPMAAV